MGKGAKKNFLRSSLRLFASESVGIDMANEVAAGFMPAVRSK